ncbi:MAG: cytochrome c peroxidase [Polaribacter sp.]|jgi:cytochrome c peroxidase
MNISKTSITFILFLLLALFIVACTADELNNPLDSKLEGTLVQSCLTGSLDEYLLPREGAYDAIPQDPKNPITAEKVALGKMLFFETGVALAPIQQVGKESYSCGSCHVPAAGFLPGSAQGVADGGVGYGNAGEGRSKYISYDDNELDAQGARPLSMCNVAFSTNTSWNGQFGAGGVNIGTESVWNNNTVTSVNHLGFSGIESQNIEGVELHRMVYDKAVVDSLGYTDLFDQVFESVPQEDRYTKMTASLAISAYTRTIIPYKAPFQQWLQGNSTAMTSPEKRGAILFFGKAGCVNCHKEAALSAIKFEAIGVEDLYQNGGLNTDVSDSRNLGRGGFTGLAEDLFKFRIPQLYNLKNAGHYFHGSSKNSLREVVEYFNNAIPENENVPAAQLSVYFRPLHLTEQEIDDLTIFLEDSLYDDDLDRYVPEAVLSGNCIPNNDLFSRIDLGCN